MKSASLGLCTKANSRSQRTGQRGEPGDEFRKVMNRICVMALPEEGPEGQGDDSPEREVVG